MDDTFDNFKQSEVVQKHSLPQIVDVQQPEYEDKRKTVKHSVVFPQSIHPPDDFNDEIYQLNTVKLKALNFNFTPDPFQEKAFAALERGESVLVAAHTSAGKTAVAEYAIALALTKKQRVIYTSPIKALSNQKFRDLSLHYNQNQQNQQNIKIGLMTGDTTVNRNAEIIVMTTEILKNMLQQNTEILRELGCVIFDEVHYMKNAERGLVWEDCLSLLDSRVNFVFLSATIPNAPEFAAWVAQTHQKVVHVVYTEYRPVPLQFFVAPIGAKQAFLLYSSDDPEINQSNLNKAIQALPFFGSPQNQGTKKFSKKNAQQTIIDLREAEMRGPGADCQETAAVREPADFSAAAARFGAFRRGPFGAFRGGPPNKANYARKAAFDKRRRCAPLRAFAVRERNHGNPVPGGLGENRLRDGDLRDGPQFARQVRRFRGEQEIRRPAVEVRPIRRVHLNGREEWKAWKGHTRSGNFSFQRLGGIGRYHPNNAGPSGASEFGVSARIRQHRELFEDGGHFAGIGGQKVLFAVLAQFQASTTLIKN